MPPLEYYANSADLVQMPQNAASDQGQHCLLTGISVQKNNRNENVCQESLKLTTSLVNDSLKFQM